MDWPKQLTSKPSFPKANSVLFNGQGNYAGQFPEKIYSKVVQRGTKYLLRIINTSLDTDYIFSIDNHNFTVIAADFVPIVPYWTNSLNIAIGQRYTVILDAVPNNENGEEPADGNYWIRAISATGCSGFETGNAPGERQGIIRYNSSDMSVPTTTRPAYDITCKDEPYASLVPIVSWNVTPVAIDASTQRFDIDKPQFPNYPAKGDNFFWWAFGDSPMWLNPSEPTILGLANQTWPATSVVVSEPANGVSLGSWIYMIITAPAGPISGGYFPVAHPVHLHGHDFALLGQGSNSDDIPNNVTLQFDNLPRRDTVLITSGGWMAIAFRADNPGSWLLHCHIPWHASNGLALQILESQKAFQTKMTPERLNTTQSVCDSWIQWYGNSSNWWSPAGPFQDDSGI